MTRAGVPVQLKIVLQTYPQQLINQPHNTARGSQQDMTQLLGQGDLLRRHALIFTSGLLSLKACPRRAICHSNYPRLQGLGSVKCSGSFHQPDVLWQC